MTASLTHTLFVDGNFCVVTLAGKLDSVTSPSFAEFLKTSVPAITQTVVLDMGSLGYVSSAGLRELLVLAKQCKARGGKVCLVKVQPLVNEVLAMAGFNALFKSFASVDEARRAVSTQASGDKGTGFWGRIFN